MTNFRSPLSLRGAGTTNTAGAAVSLGRTPRSAIIFGLMFVGGGSTKCSVRAEVQMLPASTRWVAIGAAASTVTSTMAGRSFRSTSAVPFMRARLRLVTRTTGATALPDTVSGYIVGV